MSNTGRYIIKDLESGRTFFIEPISNSDRPADWGDVDVVTKKLTGHYGEKHKGAINESESVINEEKGFKNIITIGPGENPMDYIKKLLDKEGKI